MTLTSLISIVVSATLYYGFFHLNAWCFKAFELHAGANWIFLPAGLRLICTLVFGIDGAIGLLLASLLLAHASLLFDPVTGIVSALISAGAPYLVYLGALRFGLAENLEKLSTSLLSRLALVSALANASLHSLWFVMRGIHADFLHNWVTMFSGDLLGTLIMLYAMKLLMALYRLKARQSV